MSEPLFGGGEVLLDRYRINAYFAEGGMQQVFLATDLTFGRTVVLKAPKNPSAKKRFARSAAMSARVSHANVAKTLDYLDTPSGNYLVEEYILGKDLKRVLDEHFSYLDPHLAARVLHQLAKGVAASHHAGVFHRDLKPSNIIVSTDPNLTAVKITDFGIAKMAEYEMVEGVDMNNESSITGSDTVLGALPYMAPEMITKAKEATIPADVWAVGAILYHLMSGKPPFGTGLQAIPGIVSGKLPPKPALLTKIQFAPLGEELWSVVGNCLQPDIPKRLTADQLVSSCAKLCYSDAPRSEGRISRFGFKRGAWGFIDRDGVDVFFHEESFYGGKPHSGAMVNFACFEGAPNLRAFPVLPLKVGSSF